MPDFVDLDTSLVNFRYRANGVDREFSVDASDMVLLISSVDGRYAVDGVVDIGNPEYLSDLRGAMEVAGLPEGLSFSHLLKVRQHCVAAEEAQKKNID